MHLPVVNRIKLEIIQQRHHDMHCYDLEPSTCTSILVQFISHVLAPGGIGQRYIKNQLGTSLINELRQVRHIIPPTKLGYIKKN